MGGLTEYTFEFKGQWGFGGRRSALESAKLGNACQTKTGSTGRAKARSACRARAARVVLGAVNVKSAMISY